MRTEDIGGHAGGNAERQDAILPPFEIIICMLRSEYSHLKIKAMKKQMEQPLKTISTLLTRLGFGLNTGGISQDLEDWSEVAATLHVCESYI